MIISSKRNALKDKAKGTDPLWAIGERAFADEREKLLTQFRFLT